MSEYIVLQRRRPVIGKYCEHIKADLVLSLYHAVSYIVSGSLSAAEIRIIRSIKLSAAFF